MNGSDAPSTEHTEGTEANGFLRCVPFLQWLILSSGKLHGDENEICDNTSIQGEGLPAPETIAPLVAIVRGEKVLLDADLAELYGVATKVLNQAVKRNLDRFPEDFMFQLTVEEAGAVDSLRSQSVTLKQGRGTHRKYLPFVFTEQGVAMLSSVLRSSRAVEVNIAIMRTFVQLRRLMDSNRLLAEMIESLEKKYDQQFRVVFDAIKQLIADDKRPKREIGFHSDSKPAKTLK